MPSIVAYHHLSLTVTDLERSVEWYREVLGFSVEADVRGDGFLRKRLVHPDSGLTLTLTRHERGSADRFSELRTGMDHVAFLVPGPDDLEEWKRRFEALGVTHSEIQTTGPGAALIALRDPDNIQLEVFTRPG